MEQSTIAACPSLRRPFFKFLNRSVLKELTSKNCAWCLCIHSLHVCFVYISICVCVCVDCFCRFDLRKGLHRMRKVLKCAFAYDSLMVLR